MVAASGGVAVIDQRRLIREGLATLINSEPGLTVLVCAEQWTEDAGVADLAVVGPTSGAVIPAEITQVRFTDDDTAREIVSMVVEAGNAGTPTRSDATSSLPSPHQLLSLRETTVLELTAAGHSAAQIAVTLELSARTVEKYKHAVLAKLGVKNQAEATARAIELNLIDPAGHD